MKPFQYAQPKNKKNESIMKCCLVFAAAQLEYTTTAETVLKDVAVDLLSHMTVAT